jgi:hypothetical protein
MGCANSADAKHVTAKDKKTKKSLLDKIHPPKIINVKANDGHHVDMDHHQHVTNKDTEQVFFNPKNNPRRGSGLNLIVNHGQVLKLNDSHDSNRSTNNKKHEKHPEPKLDERMDSEIMETPPTLINHAVVTNEPVVSNLGVDTE